MSHVGGKYFTFVLNKCMKFAFDHRSLLLSHAISFWHRRRALMNYILMRDPTKGRGWILGSSSYFQVGSSTFGFTSIHSKCQLGSASLTNLSIVLASVKCLCSKWNIEFRRVVFNKGEVITKECLNFHLLGPIQQGFELLKYLSNLHNIDHNYDQDLV